MEQGGLLQADLEGLADLDILEVIIAGEMQLISNTMLKIGEVILQYVKVQEQITYQSVNVYLKSLEVQCGVTLPAARMLEIQLNEIIPGEAAPI